MRALHPSLSPDDVDSLLSSGDMTTDLGDSGRDDVFGHGLIDALKAVQAAQLLANDGTLPPQPAIIVAAPNQLTLGSASSALVNLSNQGEETASITGFSADAGWLNVSASNVDVNGLGEYLVSIDRTNLNDSIYLGTITFDLSTGNSLPLQVTMQVGTVDNAGNVGQVYMVLLDESSTPVDNTLAVEQGDGLYDYSFTNVTAGRYRIVAGSDIDNDTFICQLAEACGGYPTIDALSEIEVINTDISGLDFVIDILANFGTGTAQSGDGEQPQGFSRPGKKLVKPAQ